MVLFGSQGKIGFAPGRNAAAETEYLAETMLLQLPAGRRGTVAGGANDNDRLLLELVQFGQPFVELAQGDVARAGDVALFVSVTKPSPVPVPAPSGTSRSWACTRLCSTTGSDAPSVFTTVTFLTSTMTLLARR